ncbi:MAG: histidine triad nucleotide-binding protein [Coriobacteriia bacterium]|nr:histidine triad nucleotide-binding protein [Coriobacteriia bacterium]
MGNCIFCMIVSGEVPAKKVYEDDNVLAFDDIAPQAPVHTLIIPKQHFDHMGDGVSLVDMANVFSVVPQIAELKGVSESGYRVIVNNGRDANQTVGHLHVHVLGGRPMSHGMVGFDD